MTIQLLLIVLLIENALFINFAFYGFPLTVFSVRAGSTQESGQSTGQNYSIGKSVTIETFPARGCIML